MGDSITDAFLARSGKEFREQLKSGAFQGRLEDGTKVDIRTGRDLAEAFKRNASGRYYYRSGDEILEGRLENLPRDFDPRILEKLQLVTGDEGVNAHRATLEHNMRAEAAENPMRAALKGGLRTISPLDLRTDKERYVDKLYAEENPWANIAGTAAYTTGLGMLGGGALRAAGAGTKAVLGAQVVGEGLVAEHGFSSSYNRDYSVNAAFMDMVVGGAFVGGGHVFSKWSQARKAKKATEIAEMYKFGADEMNMPSEVMERSIDAWRKMEIGQASVDDVRLVAKTARIIKGSKAHDDILDWVDANPEAFRMAKAGKGVKKLGDEAQAKLSALSDVQDLIKKKYAVWKAGAKADVNVEGLIMEMRRAQDALPVNVEVKMPKVPDRLPPKRIETFDQIHGKKVRYEEQPIPATDGKPQKLYSFDKLRVNDADGAAAEQIWRSLEDRIDALRSGQRFDSNDLHELVNSWSKGEGLKTSFNPSNRYLGDAIDILRKAKQSEDIFGAAGLARQELDPIVHDMGTIFGVKGQVKKGKLLETANIGDEIDFSDLFTRMEVAQDSLRKLVANKVLSRAEAEKYMMAIQDTRTMIRKSLEVAEDGTPGALLLKQTIDDLGIRLKTASENKNGLIAGFSTAFGGMLGFNVGGYMGGFAGVQIGRAIGRWLGYGKQAARTSAVRTQRVIAKESSTVVKALEDPAKVLQFTQKLRRTSHVMREPAEKRNTYIRAAQGLRNTVMNPDNFVRDVQPVAMMMQGTDMVVPMTGAYVGAMYHLYKTLPSHDPSTVSDMEVTSWMGRYEMVTDPMIALDHVASGTFTAEMRDTLTTVYPQLYGDMVANILYKADQSKLGYDAKLKLFQFTGVPMDRTMTPEYMEAAWNQGAQTQMQDRVMHGGPGPHRQIQQKYSGVELTQTQRHQT